MTPRFAYVFGAQEVPGFVRGTAATRDEFASKIAEFRAKHNITLQMWVKADDRQTGKTKEFYV